MAVRRTTTNKRKFIEALDNNMGNIAAACKSTGVSRSCYYKWINNDPKFKEKCDFISESNIDYVESKLMTLIYENNPTAIIFFLKTKGRNRGYVEKLEQDVTVNPFLDLMKAATSEDDQ